ncbi:MAG TPA: DUF945 family protein [Burkholderiales bacterium]|nr:DUF945 family protein [Burkholderiales bacterium]HTT39265.1 DUF945 family protein [Burkholderiales bacterium]
MNKAVFVAVPIVVLGAAAAAIPWYAGSQYERAVRAQVSELSRLPQLPLNVTLVRYSRGWLSSEAVVRFTLKAQPGLFLDLRQQISQWPDPNSGWLRVRSLPEWSGPVKAALDYYFDGQPALSFDSVIGFDGSGKTTVTSPAFNKPSQHDPAATVSWGGLQGALLEGADRRWTMHATAPHLQVEGGEAAGGMKTLTFDTKWGSGGQTADWQGETKLALAELRFSGAREQLELKDMSWAAYQRSSGDNVSLGYAVRVGEGSSAKAGETTNSFSNAVLELEFDQISKKALTSYIEGMRSAQEVASTQDHLAGDKMLDLFAELLRGSPVVRLKQLGVETPSGAVSAQATVTFDGRNLTDVRPSPELLARLQGKGHVDIASGLLRAQLQRKTRPQVEVALQQQGAQPNEENIKALSEKLTEAQLKSLTDNGILRLNGTNFTLEAELAGGQVLLNGQPASQVFGGLMAPSLPHPQPIGASRPDPRAALETSGALSLAQVRPPAPEAR